MCNVCLSLSLTSYDMRNGGDIEFLLRALDTTFWVLHFHHSGLQLKAEKQQQGLIHMYQRKLVAGRSKQSNNVKLLVTNKVKSDVSSNCSVRIKISDLSNYQGLKYDSFGITKLYNCHLFFFTLGYTFNL